MYFFRIALLSITIICGVSCQQTSGQSRTTLADAQQSQTPEVIQVRSGSNQPETPATVSAPAPTSSSVATPSPTQEPAVKPQKISYNSITTNQPVVAMTFDDGPHPELTPRLLDLLKSKNIHATFYLIGQNAAAYPEIVKRIVAEGHEVGNHTYTHPALSKSSQARVQSEMEKTNAAIFAASGVYPKTMRPPYGATNASVNKLLSENYNFKVIMWSVDPLDWKYRNASRVSSEIAKAKAGDIILAHDIHASTVNGMDEAFNALLAKGLRFVTVSELLAMDSPAEPIATEKPIAATPKKSKKKLAAQ